MQAVNPTTVVATADLFAAVTDPAGAAQARAAPPLPITVPLGRTITVTLDLA